MKISALLVLGKALGFSNYLFGGGLDRTGLIISPGSYIRALINVFNKEAIDKLLGPKDAVPSVRLDNPTRFKAVDLTTFEKGLEYSYLPLCPVTQVLALECICSKDYDSADMAYSLEYRSGSVVAYNKEKQQVIVSFKFTNGIRNWLTNFDYKFAHFEGADEDVLVHHGMYNHYLSIHNETMAKVIKLVDSKPVKSIFVTGYSLGGSIAVMSVPFWAQFKRKHNIPVTVVSYAGARTGNLAAKIYFENQGIPINRYSNKNDIVPQLPPRFAGYVHAGLEIHERSKPDSSETELVVCSQEYDEDPDCSNGEPGRRNPIMHFVPFNNLLILPPYCGKGSVTKFHLPQYAE